MQIISQGSTDQSAMVRIVTEAGIPVTDATSATGGIAMWYRRQGGLKVAISLSDLAALDTAHTDGGLKHIGDGYYRLDLPDAAVAEGATFVAIGGGATGDVVIGQEIDLVANSYQVKSLVCDKNDATITDRFACIWTKNGADVTSGVTTPLIQVVKVSDGSDLVAETAMTAVGSTGALRYDGTASLMDPGAVYLVIYTATIDGAARKSRWFVTRDSA